MTVTVISKISTVKMSSRCCLSSCYHIEDKDIEESKHKGYFLSNEHPVIFATCGCLAGV